MTKVVFNGLTKALLAQAVLQIDTFTMISLCAPFRHRSPSPLPRHVRRHAGGVCQRRALLPDHLLLKFLHQGVQGRLLADMRGRHRAQHCRALRATCKL